MRIWHRLRTFVPLLLTITMAAECRAQMMGGPSYGGPAFMTDAGSPYAPAGYQSMPQSFQSHPMISPFDNAFEQHFSSDGIWFRRALSAMGQPYDFYLNVDYINTKTHTRKGIIGDPSVPQFFQDDIINNAGNLPDTLFLPYYPWHNFNETLANENQGVRISGGANNQLGWRFKWSAEWQGDSTDVFDARRWMDARRGMHFFDAITLEASGGVANGALPGNLRHINERQILESLILGIRTFDAADSEEFGVAGSTFEILDRNLFPYGSIGLRTGDDLFGVSQLFDLDYVIKHHVEAYGGGFQFEHSPMYENDKLQVRPLLGARVFRLTEGFGFLGAYSGLDYTANLPDGLDDDDDFVIDNVEENGTNNFTDPVTDDTQEILVRSFVSSNVRSTMAGPEIGAAYEIAEKSGVTFFGSTRVGALFNTEKMYLSGDNIGNTSPTAVEVDVDPNSPTFGLTIRSQMFDTTTTGVGRTQNYFEDQQGSTHVSPLFEQSLNAELPIFSRVPVLKDMWQFEHAKLRLGWTYTWIGEVADPNSSIVWVSNPRAGIFPYLRANRTSFQQTQFNVGIHWEL